MLNIGGVKSFIIWRSNTRNEITGRSYLKTLSRELCMDLLKVRATLTNLPRQLQTQVRALAGVPAPRLREAPEEGTSHGRCSLCTWKQNRKTRIRSARCRIYICGEHTGLRLCLNCPLDGPENMDTDE
ncbi:hypothetical protein J6590_007947 [Homalodisca vitripennis]|nr:hypothetical protein J6590_007947 [Homalodisca vitripennis]